MIEIVVAENAILRIEKVIMVVFRWDVTSSLENYIQCSRIAIMGGPLGGHRSQTHPFSETYYNFPNVLYIV